MFCILLANLRKQVKTPYNLLVVNEHFAHKPDAKRATLYAFTTASLHKVLLNKPIEFAIHNCLYG